MSVISGFTYLFTIQPLPLLDLFTLLFEVLHFGSHGPLLGIIRGEGIGRSIEIFLGLVVSGCQVGRAGISASCWRLDSPRDAVDQCRQTFAVLACNAFYVALKHEKVFGLD